MFKIVMAASLINMPGIPDSFLSSAHPVCEYQYYEKTFSSRAMLSTVENTVEKIKALSPRIRSKKHVVEGITTFIIWDNVQFITTGYLGNTELDSTMIKEVLETLDPNEPYIIAFENAQYFNLVCPGVNIVYINARSGGELPVAQSVFVGIEDYGVSFVISENCPGPKDLKYSLKVNNIPESLITESFGTRTPVTEGRAGILVFNYYPVCTYAKDCSFYSVVSRREFWEKFIIPAIANLRNNRTSGITTVPKTVPQIVEYLGLEQMMKKYNEIKSLSARDAEIKSVIRLRIKEVSVLSKESEEICTNLVSLNDYVAQKQFKNEPITIELANVMALPYVTGITMEEKMIIVNTDKIKIFDDDALELGPYKIKMSFSNVITIENIGNPAHSYAHPHCPQNSEPCFGNFSDIYRHLDKKEYYTVVEMLHVFLSTFNPGDEWGAHMLWWDETATIKHYVEEGYDNRIPGRFNDLYYALTGKCLRGYVPPITESSIDEDHDDWCYECDNPYSECTCERDN